MKIVSLAHLAIPAVMVAALFTGTPVSAQTTPALLGVVDVDAVVEQSLAGKRLKVDRESYVTTYQNQVKDTQGKLRAEQTELEQQRSVMAPDVFAEKAKAWQQRIQDFDGQVHLKEERLQYASNQALNQIITNVVEVSKDVAKERGLNAVIARQAMLIVDPGMDISKQVLDKLNVKLPQVVFQNPDTIQLPDGQGAPAAKPAAAAAPAAAKKK